MADLAVKAPRGTDWADDGDDAAPDLANAIPAPTITKNKDGTETIVTIFINEEGRKVKRTQRIRRSVVKKRENPRVAERRAWDKFGVEAGRAAGPHPDTTTLGENIIFRPQAGFKAGGAQEKAPEEDKKAEALKKMQIKCRICSGDHFTTKCPFKDTMAPTGEDAAPADMDAITGEDKGGLGAGGSSYVPPHMRKGAAGAGGGERMGGKFERDDLATLRVTNVSSCSSLNTSSNQANESRFPSSQKKAICARCSSVTVASQECSWPRIVRQAEQRASLSSVMPIDQTLHVLARRWTALVMVILFFVWSLRRRRRPRDVSELRSTPWRSRDRGTQEEAV